MKRRKLPLFILFFAVFLVLFSFPVFAAGDDLFVAADKIIRDIYTHIAGISTILAALMTTIAVVGIKFSGDQHKAEAGWDWLKRIWIAWAIINLIGAFTAYVVPLFSGYAYLP